MTDKILNSKRLMKGFTFPSSFLNCTPLVHNIITLLILISLDMGLKHLNILL